MQKPEPFPITAEDRAKAVAAMMRIIETGEPEDQIEAAAVLVSMVEQNIQAGENSWCGKPFQN
ncbi:MAG: hypothetical protein KDB01_12200 [Planctomycetaceae bacterium]|nr:hypothetical protein [Planctomycetaceae bacterium]